MHHGTDPIGYLDHINGDRSDDRIDNLRDVVLGENSRNRGRHDGSLYVTDVSKVCNKYWYMTRHLRFGIALWSDEDTEAIQQELHNAIAPIIERIYDNRRGRQRPPSLQVAPDFRPSNTKPAYRRY
jgi:hypothetical protein